MLQSPTETRGASGGVSTSFTDVREVWGGVEPLTTREILAADQFQGEITHRIILDYLDSKGVTKAWRIKDNTTSPALIYTLHGPPMNLRSKNRDVHIMASEGIDNG